MTFDALRHALRNPAPLRATDMNRAPRGVRLAAVLMLLSDDPDPCITFVRRATTLRHHAGQVALPGGGVDEDDDGPVDAALREATEEVGLRRDLVQVLGQLPPVWVPKSNFDVVTVVVTWPGGELHAMDPAETASVHQFPVSLLASSEVRCTSRHPKGFKGPAFVLPDVFVWGLTAHLLDWVLRLGGWEKNWDREHVVPIPAEYLRD